ncbi:MAG TPA: cellulase family glycosylhydrolase [Victivallales bacterium]|nr:cellulase family glycosylhydrolase [Victivallales bacterium]HRR28181.1 cellulase family glycosylhydrolase [Victivallales bacterium]
MIRTLKCLTSGVIILTCLIGTFLFSDEKKLYDFENGIQGWWNFKSEDVTLELQQETQDNYNNTKGALKITYKYGKPGSYLGIGVEPKWVMEGKAEITKFKNGHIKLAIKALPPTKVKIELRCSDKKTYSYTLPKVGEIWGIYSIPLSEFKSKDTPLNAEGLSISQLIIIPLKSTDSESVIWIDEISISSEKLNLSEKPYEYRIKGKILSGKEGVPDVSINLKKKDGITELAEWKSKENGEFLYTYHIPRETFLVEPENACISEKQIEAIITAEKDGFATSLKEVELNLGNNSVEIQLKQGKKIKELHVSGNKIITSDGEEVWLQGLCIDSLEWSATGDNVLKSVIVAIDEWNANVIRLPVKDDFWFGKGKWQNDGGVFYRNLIDEVLKLCSERAVYLVLDLHRFGAPMPEHAKFWENVAEKYKNNPGILFEIFNEAHGISWEIWKNGGDLKGAKEKSGDVNVEENKEKNSGNYSVGMQELINTIRNTGAKNIIIAGGLDWSYDLTGIVDGFALDDKGGNGIVYSTHIYPWKRNWEKFLCLADKYPIFIGEVGNLRRWEDFSFIKPEARHEPVGPESAWPKDMLGLIQKYKFHWTGFSFHPRCGPMVIQDWNYTPTDYWGVFVKDALTGKKFELKNLR